MLISLPKALPDGQRQLDLFEQWARATPSQFTHTLELFDAIPKFAFGSLSSLTRKKPLDIVKRDFVFNGQRMRVTIEPTVLSSKDSRTKKEVRKEILPGSREEQVYRVLKKLASDPFTERHIREGRNPSVALLFSLNTLRVKMKDVKHEYRWNEIKEALQVLSRTPIKLLNLDTGRELYSSSSYLDVEYVGDVDESKGSSTKVSVSFNRLAARAILNGMTDWVHYERLMSLRDPLAEWIYEMLTRSFRQAGVEYGYTLTLSRILSESPMRTYKQLRDNVVRVRQALRLLTEREVLRVFPMFEEKLKFKNGPVRGGRKQIADAEWILHPSEAVIADIRADNGRKLRMETAAQQ